MACHYPIPAARDYPRPGMILHPKDREPTHWLPCTKCIGCRDNHAATWTLRLRHEARFHKNNTFLTLTYDDDHLPDGLQKRDLQLFWKRLRKETNDRIKYYACGEYGDRTKRPHYHAATFSMPKLGDEKPYDATNTQSALLNQLWKNGQVTLSDLTPERMRYVTGYVLKKAGYRRQVYCDPDGVELEKPFQLMSKGLGSLWLDHYKEQFTHGYARVSTIGDAKMAIPRYYREKLKITDKELAEAIQKSLDDRRATLPAPDPARGRAAEQIRQQQIKTARNKTRL